MSALNILKKSFSDEDPNINFVKSNIELLDHEGVYTGRDLRIIRNISLEQIKEK